MADSSSFMEVDSIAVPSASGPDQASTFAGSAISKSTPHEKNEFPGHGTVLAIQRLLGTFLDKVAILAAGVSLGLLAAASRGAAQDAVASTTLTNANLGDLSIEQLMELKVETVYGASKHEQKVTQAPSSVSIITAEEIKKLGYRTLADVLRSTRGVYVAYASRQAGMAEVATGVLHNVGNVLNSVNVSATLIGDQLKKSKTENLGKVAAMMREHAADLGVFITTDAKGRQLPAYLGQLAEHLAASQATLLGEVEQLRSNIEHIKEIVAMQQSYAKVSGLTEVVNVSDLVEDSLRLNTGALSRHGVQLVRECEAVPPITVEKHKVLQILVNLIRNAKYACSDSGRPDRKIILRITRAGERVRIAVIDNGVGIPQENLTRIFNHGFTTKKDGHGFGLHSGALELHSDGLGQGATFTLNLPLEPAAEFKSKAA